MLAVNSISWSGTEASIGLETTSRQGAKTPRRQVTAVLFGVLAFATPAHSQDTSFARLVRAYTTDSRFLPASVATLPTSAMIPSPQEHFGTIAGAPDVEHHAAELYGYYRALAAATPRVRVMSLGPTEGGRDLVLVAIADSATMQHLDAYRATLARLADPRTVPAESLDAVLGRAKPIYYLMGGLHSTEMGSPEMLTELAYRLAVGADSTTRAITSNVITLINPVAEPDGRDRQVDWYNRYTKNRADIEDGFPLSAPYWGDYARHDDNRDGLQMALKLTQAISRTYYDWHPTVMHDLHESIALLYVSTGTGPYNPHNDPIAISEWQLLANNDITALDAQGLPGVWTWAFFDGWWPGYGAWVANNHNSIGRFYETFGNAGAGTYVRDLSGEAYAGDSVTSRQWYRPAPPTRKVRWSARDNVNYMEAGVLASLTFTAHNAAQLLREFWQKGVNSIARGRSEKPYAYVIPGFAHQRDPRRAAYLVNQLERQGIEIRKRTTGDSSGSAGDFVILRDQPYGDLVANLLARTAYPASAKYPPYDDVAWTLGDLYGVSVSGVNDTAVFHWSGLELLKDTVAATAQVTGSGSVFVMAYRAQGELLPALYALRAEQPGAHAYAAESSFTVGKDTFPLGSVIWEGLSANAASKLAADYALPLVAAAAPSVPRHELRTPRVAIYHTWFDTQDEGWSRYTFEHAHIPYTPIDKDDLKRGRLRERFDVILVPNARGGVPEWIHGVDSKWGPLPYEKTAQSPAFGAPEASPDITGGPGFEGLGELQKFVDAGGEIVTLASSTSMISGTGIAAALSPHGAGGLFHPGSVVRARIRHAASPILYGYPSQFTIFRGNGPLLEVDRRDSAMLVLQYGAGIKGEKDEGPMLGMPETAKAPAAKEKEKPSTDSAYVVSGMVRNENEILGQGAIFDVPVGKGRVIAFTFDALHRYLNHHEFPLVWNALLNWDARIR